MKEVNDVFISYGRAESKVFANKLVDRLTEKGFDVWFDKNDIPLAVDFQNQIDDGIEKADNFVFIIAPHSIKSPYCLKEVELAVKLNKRIIPILHIEPTEKEVWDMMHPTIAKLNWIYFREQLDSNKPLEAWEQIDDFEAGFNGLISILGHHQDFVKMHTSILTKALYWERHQRKTEFLLSGNERLEAEAWLKYRFEKEQPPCEPTILHCEYITECTKNANNLMTDIFISYATQNKEIMEKIKSILMRNSFTVWTNLTDIKTGVEFQEEINKGIEETDNIVYLISPESLASEYCQHEINYASQLNKRIISLMIKETDLNAIPKELRAIQFIDTLPERQENPDEKFKIATDKLLRELHNDQHYHNQHKKILVKAIKWQKQNQNPSILLRGYGLKNAQAWLKTANKRRTNKPLPIQSGFIAESEAQPADTSTEVFLSYSREDGDFARMINDALQDQGKSTWFDQESIDSGADFQEEIYRGIEVSDNFLFLISPASIKSPYAIGEVEHAMKFNKRMITALYKDVEQTELPSGLQTVQWIDFKSKQFQASFSELIRSLDTDREHVRQHTKWLQRAVEWEGNDKSKDLLLRGREFTAANLWKQEAEEKKKNPSLTPLQKEFIYESNEAILAHQRAIERRRKIVMGASVTVAIVVTILAIVALFQRQEAVKQRGIAVEQRDRADSLRVVAEDNEAEAIFQKGVALVERDRADSMRVLAVEQRDRADSLRVVAEDNEAEAVKQKNIAEVQRNLALQGQIKILLGVVDRLRNEHDQLGQLMASMKAAQQMQKATEMPEALRDRTIKTLKLTLGEIQEQNRLESSGKGILSVNFSHNGQKIVTINQDKNIEVWGTDGPKLSTWKVGDQQIHKVRFSPDGQTIAGIGEDGTVTLWSANGEPIKTFAGHKHWVWDVIFSMDGKQLATASHDHTVKLWNNQGEVLQTFQHSRELTAISFSPDNKKLAAASWDGTITIWNMDGEKVSFIEDRNSSFTSLAFSPDGKTIAAGNMSREVKIWSIAGALIQTFQGHNSKITSVIYSPDGKILISGSADRTVKLWQIMGGKLLETLEGHSGEITSLTVNSEGSTIASGSKDHVKIWSLENIINKEIHQILEKADVDGLIDLGCEWLQNYLENNQNIKEDDRTLCQEKEFFIGENIH